MSLHIQFFYSKQARLNQCLHVSVSSVNTYVAVLGRNWTLFHCVLWSHYHVRSAVTMDNIVHVYIIHAVTQYFCCGRGSYALCKLMNTWNIYPVHMGPTPNRSSALQCARNIQWNNVQFLPGTATYTDTSSLCVSKLFYNLSSALAAFFLFLLAS